MSFVRFLNGLIRLVLLIIIFMLAIASDVQAGWRTVTCDDRTSAVSGTSWEVFGFVRYDTFECVDADPGPLVPKLFLDAYFNSNGNDQRLAFRSYKELQFGTIGTLSGTVINETVTPPATLDTNGLDHDVVFPGAGAFDYFIETTRQFRLSYTLTFTGTQTSGIVSWSNIEVSFFDTTAPTLVSMTKLVPLATVTDRDSLIWRIVFSEDVVDVDAADFSVSGTTADLTVSGSGSTYFVTASGGDLASFNGDVTLSFANTVTINDTSAAPINALVRPTETNTYTLENLSKVTNVSFQTQDGHYKAGDTVVIDVTFEKPVTVTGTPTLKLETGANDRDATYVSGSGSTKLTFHYIVQAGDMSADLDYTDDTALVGTLSGFAYAADLTLPDPGATGSLAANGAVTIDTGAPVVTDGAISVSGATGTGGIFTGGDTLAVHWDTSGSDGDPNLSNSLGAVTVDFLPLGAAVRLQQRYLDQSGLHLIPLIQTALRGKI